MGHDEDFTFEETTAAGAAQGSTIHPLNCEHDEVRTTDWDGGIDPQTGYHDVATLVTCLHCGEEWHADEYAAMLAAERERGRNWTWEKATRKPAGSEHVRVEKREVA